MNGFLKSRGGEFIPVQSCHIHAIVEEFCARFTYTQTFTNTTENNVEVEYSFRANDSSWCLCAFEAIVDGKRWHGVVKEKQEAMDTYSDSIAESKGAYLVTRETGREDKFKAMLGNVPPYRTVCTIITYVAELTIDNEERRNEEKTTDEKTEMVEFGCLVISLDKLNKLPIVDDPKVFLSLLDEEKRGLLVTADVTMKGGLARIACPSHNAFIEYSDSSRPDGVKESAAIRLAAPTSTNWSTKQNSRWWATRLIDFILKVYPILQDRSPRFLLEVPSKGASSAPKPPCFMASFVPIASGKDDVSFDDEEQPCEAIFLVDRSGSMAERMTSTKRALHALLHSLPEGSFFDIFSFGSTISSLFDGSKPYLDETLQLAKEHVNLMSADMGGTEILQPLQRILNMAPQSEECRQLPRRIFVLTDGEVQNTAEVLDAVRRYLRDSGPSISRARTKIFAIGIGNGASIPLVKGLAREGGGRAEFVIDTDAIDYQLLGLLQEALAPEILDLRVELPGDSVPAVPIIFSPHLHSIQFGRRTTLYGIFEENNSDGGDLNERLRQLGDITLRITGTQICRSPSSLSRSFSVDIRSPVSIFMDKGGIVSCLATRSRIRDLESVEMEKTHQFNSATDPSEKADRNKEAQQIREQIVRLSIQHQLLSSQTSFLVVEDHRKDATLTTLIPVRAEPPLEQKLPKKGFLHASRHHWAVVRHRGPGGAFLKAPIAPPVMDSEFLSAPLNIDQLSREAQLDSEFLSSTSDVSQPHREAHLDCEFISAPNLGIPTTTVPLLQAESAPPMLTALATPPHTPRALPPPTGAPKKRRGGKLRRFRRTNVRALVSDEEEEKEKEGQHSLDSIKGYTTFSPSPQQQQQQSAQPHQPLHLLTTFTPSQSHSESSKLNRDNKDTTPSSFDVLPFIGAQKASGCWEVQDSLLLQLSITAEDFSRFADSMHQKFGPAAEETTTLWMTFLVVAYVSIHISNDTLAKRRWHLVERKALRWLQKHLKEDEVQKCLADSKEWLANQMLQ